MFCLLIVCSCWLLVTCKFKPNTAHSLTTLLYNCLTCFSLFAAVNLRIESPGSLRYTLWIDRAGRILLDLALTTYTKQLQCNRQVQIIGDLKVSCSEKMLNRLAMSVIPSVEHRLRVSLSGDVTRCYLLADSHQAELSRVTDHRVRKRFRVVSCCTRVSASVP